MMTRPGFGSRHPALAVLLGEYRAAANHEVAWLDGAMPLRVSAYTEAVDLPDELVTSVRCIVRVGGQIVFCTNKDGSHPWPGGRRRPGESYLETAAREVHEETGWHLEPASLVRLGWLHLEHLAPRQLDENLPYPDFLQLVFGAEAMRREVALDEGWIDVEGYEQGSNLITVEEALQSSAIDPVAKVFLRLLDSS